MRYPHPIKNLGGYNVESAANPAGVGIYRNVRVCSRICAEEVMPGGLRGPLQECGQELVHSGLHGKVLTNAQREEIALGFRKSGHEADLPAPGEMAVKADDLRAAIDWLIAAKTSASTLDPTWTQL
jgi:hypothetical protein